MDDSFEHFKVNAMSGALGAELSGLDVNTLDESAFDQLRRALNRYHVLAIRDQRMDAAALHRFARRLGPFSGNPIHLPLDDFDDIVKVVHEADDSGPNFGGDWHMDLPWFECPPGQTLLYVEECPAAGGDTLFADLHLAFEALSARMQSLLEGLAAVHTGRNSFAVNAALTSIRVREQGWAESQVDTEHPLICTHAETGQRYLFISKAIRAFQGMSEAESRPLIDFLSEHATQPRFTCRLRWMPGTLGVWQNNRLLHHAIDDYRGQRRVAYRTTVAGPKPVR